MNVLVLQCGVFFYVFKVLKLHKNKRNASKDEISINIFHEIPIFSKSILFFDINIKKYLLYKFETFQCSL